MCTLALNLYTARGLSAGLLSMLLHLPGGVCINKGNDQSQRFDCLVISCFLSAAVSQSLHTSWLGCFFLKVVCGQPGWEVVMVVGSASENLNTTTAAFASKTTFQSGLVLEAGHSGLHSLLQVGSGWSAFKLEQVKFFCLSFGERERERERQAGTLH